MTHHTAGGDGQAGADSDSQKSDLADPLADPLLDLRVRSKTAESHFVKTGDYIQIIDVDGRQCTDFQCFLARKLDKVAILPLMSPPPAR